MQLVRMKNSEVIRKIIGEELSQDMESALPKNRTVFYDRDLETIMTGSEYIEVTPEMIDEVVYAPELNGSDTVVVAPDDAAYLVVEYDKEEETLERFGRNGKVPFYLLANSMGYTIGNGLKDGTTPSTIAEIEVVAISDFINGFREVLKNRGFSYPESD